QTIGKDALLDPNPAPPMVTVRLPTLTDGTVPPDSVFNGFGCTGQNRPIAIAWSGAPENTQSFAVVMHDPDAPTGVGFFHWLVFNVPKTATLLDAASSEGLPAGAVQGMTDSGSVGYTGPCPPPGPAHRYIVTVYALDVPKLDLPPSTTGALLRFM